MPRHPPNALNLLENGPYNTDERNHRDRITKHRERTLDMFAPINRGHGRAELLSPCQTRRTAFCITRSTVCTHGTQSRDVNPGTKLNVIQPSKIPVGLDVGAPKDARHTNEGWFRKVCIVPDIDQSRRAKAAMNTCTPIEKAHDWPGLCKSQRYPALPDRTSQQTARSHSNRQVQPIVRGSFLFTMFNTGEPVIIRRRRIRQNSGLC